jgi:hypothetical protein
LFCKEKKTPAPTFCASVHETRTHKTSTTSILQQSSDAFVSRREPAEPEPVAEPATGPAVVDGDSWNADEQAKIANASAPDLFGTSLKPAH